MITVRVRNLLFAIVNLRMTLRLQVYPIFLDQFFSPLIYILLATARCNCR